MSTTGAATNGSAPTAGSSGPPGARVAFLSAELGKWDQLDAGHVEALVLTYFVDERPLRGAAGLCDWRMCGRLSRLLVGGRVTGAFGETTLYPAARVPFGRLVLVGLGKMADFDEKVAAEAARHVAGVVAKMSFTRYALVPPGRSVGLLSARRALTLYLDAEKEAAKKQSPLPDLLVVESTAGQKEAADLAHR